MKLPEPFVVILIGPPLSGKTTWIKDNFPTTDVICRDEILMDVHGSRDYNKAFSEVDQKLVDRILDQNLRESNANKKNVIIDMTHMTSKRRRQNLSYFTDDYYKLAVIFPILSDDEYHRRNEKRIHEENKDLPMYIIKRMISSYQPVSKEEGFNKIITI